MPSETCGGSEAGRARTHLATDPRLCGEIVELTEGSARVSLEAAAEMAVDERGLIHGGFVFGLADYAAMLAVNEPTVVLGAAQCRFLAPVKVGDRLEAHASATSPEGRKHPVEARVVRGDDVVFTAAFTCFVLPGHVLDSG